MIPISGQELYSPASPYGLRLTFAWKSRTWVQYDRVTAFFIPEVDCYGTTFPVLACTAELPRRCSLPNASQTLGTTS